jgi:hypothetical protein
MYYTVGVSSSITLKGWRCARVVNLCRRSLLHGCPPRYVPSSSPSPSASSQCSVIPHQAVHTQDHHPPRPRSAPRSPPSSRSTSSTHSTPSSSHAPQTSSRPSASHSTHPNLRSTLPCCSSICNSSHLIIDRHYRRLQLLQQRTAVQRCRCSRPP